MVDESAPPDLLYEGAAVVHRARLLYVPDVRWTAPRRALEIHGRDAVIAHLVAEAAAMHVSERQSLRLTRAGPRVVEESVVRFVYAGHGIAGLSAPPGTRVELGRVRLLDLRDGCIAVETSIETWSLLGTADGSPAAPAMALRGRFEAGG
jgi:hypothetical protein